MSSESQQVMTIDELSAYLKVAKSTLYKLAQEGKVPGQKVGKRWRFHKTAIDGWLAKSAPASKHDRVGSLARAHDA